MLRQAPITGALDVRATDTSTSTQTSGVHRLTNEAVTRSAEMKRDSENLINYTTSRVVGRVIYLVDVVRQAEKRGHRDCATLPSQRQITPLVTVTSVD